MLIINTYDYFGVWSDHLTLLVVYSHYSLPIYQHALHLCQTVVNLCLLLGKLHIKAKGLTLLSTQKTKVNIVSLIAFHRYEKAPDSCLEDKSDLVIEYLGLSDKQVRYGDNFSIQCAHEIQSIGGHVEYVYLVIDLLFDWEVDIVGLVGQQILLWQQRNLLLLVQVYNHAHVVRVYTALLFTLLNVALRQVSPFLVLHFLFHSLILYYPNLFFLSKSVLLKVKFMLILIPIPIS